MRWACCWVPEGQPCIYPGPVLFRRTRPSETRDTGSACWSLSVSIQNLPSSTGTSWLLNMKFPAPATGLIMVSVYFKRKRALATGLVMAGGAAGTVIQNELQPFLIHKLEWRGSLRAYSAILAWVGSISYALMMTLAPLSGKLVVRYGAAKVAVVGDLVTIGGLVW
ncbi:uncharacterized protein LOC116507598 isoform X6 [Thamnophis elegans]|uniref:uncharacterized protein LOC116507598 isoform X6 n=1 Tax=Thamnophis elegans TaxID=35005 RepID=UPI00137734C6|nr:uncharacterized protein LOC116507598 isoform X6 [Thamnophis elegans]